MDESVKMFMFARWIATLYADERIDKNGLCQTDEKFDQSSALSLLNIKDGEWWKQQLKYFNENVWVRYTNQSVDKPVKEFLKD